MIKDPRTKHFCINGDTFNGWIGPDVHFLFSTIKNGQDCCWVLTHKVRRDSPRTQAYAFNRHRTTKISKNLGPFPGNWKTFTRLSKAGTQLAKRSSKKPHPSSTGNWSTGTLYRDG